MVTIRLDKSRNVRLEARINEASVPRRFVFLNEDGTPHDISGYQFELIVYKRSNSLVKLFTLTVGDGLTVDGDDTNRLTVSITKARATQTADTVFYRLRSVAEDHTWFNGPFVWYHGESDNVEEELTIDIYQNG